MDMFKLMMLFPTLSAEISRAMADRELTIGEIIQIADKVTLQLLGKKFSDMGIAVRKTKEGKTKIEFVV